MTAPRLLPPHLRVFSAVADMVEAEFGLLPGALRGPSRKRSVAWPRQMAMLLAREVTERSLTCIGDAFGRDHTTVNHGIAAARARIARCEAEAGTFRRLLAGARALSAPPAVFRTRRKPPVPVYARPRRVAA